MKIHATTRVTVQTGYETAEAQTIVMDCDPMDSISAVVGRMLERVVGFGADRKVIDGVLKSGFHFEVVADEDCDSGDTADRGCRVRRFGSDPRKCRAFQAHDRYEGRCCHEGALGTPSCGPFILAWNEAVDRAQEGNRNSVCVRGPTIGGVILGMMGIEVTP